MNLRASRSLVCARRQVRWLVLTTALASRNTCNSPRYIDDADPVGYSAVRCLQHGRTVKHDRTLRGRSVMLEVGDNHLTRDGIKLLKSTKLRFDFGDQRDDRGDPSNRYAAVAE